MSTRVGHVHDLCPHTTLKNSLKTFGYNYAYLMLAVSGPVLVDPKAQRGRATPSQCAPKHPRYVWRSFTHIMETPLSLAKQPGSVRLRLEHI